MRSFDDMRGGVNNDFMPKLLESQAFSLFIQDNGPPHRKLHKFDEVCMVWKLKTKDSMYSSVH